MFAYYFYDVFDVPTFLGWLNVIIFSMLLMNYFIKKIKFKNKNFLRIKYFIIKYHKVLGLILLFNMIVHGYFKYGFYYLNSGIAILILVIINIFMGFLTVATKRKSLKYHKIFVVITVIVILVHILD